MVSMSDGCGRKLMTSTRKKIRKFSSLRGEFSSPRVRLSASSLHSVKKPFLFRPIGREVQPGDFWDVVVVTAVDGGQKDAYEAQIREKIHRGELPLGTTYRVFSDPPGPKIGEANRRHHSFGSNPSSPLFYSQKNGLNKVLFWRERRLHPSRAAAAELHVWRSSEETEGHPHPRWWVWNSSSSMHFTLNVD